MPRGSSCWHYSTHDFTRYPSFPERLFIEPDTSFRWDGETLNSDGPSSFRSFRSQQVSKVSITSSTSKYCMQSKQRKGLHGYDQIRSMRVATVRTLSPVPAPCTWLCVVQPIRWQFWGYKRRACSYSVQQVQRVCKSVYDWDPKQGRSASICFNPLDNTFLRL